MLELWLVRHGESVWNREGRVQGRSDPPLSALGRRQAERLAPRLAAAHFSAAYSSGILRASETARLALPSLQAEPDARLRELDFGAWEGRRWREVAQTDRAALDAWFLEPYTSHPPAGETYEALSTRVWEWRISLPEAGRVVAFTHGGPIRSLLYKLTSAPFAQSWRFEVGAASLTKLVLGDRGTILKTVNDTAHLEFGAREVGSEIGSDYGEVRT